MDGGPGGFPDEVVFDVVDFLSPDNHRQGIIFLKGDLAKFIFLDVGGVPDLGDLPLDLYLLLSAAVPQSSFRGVVEVSDFDRHRVAFIKFVFISEAGLVGDEFFSLGVLVVGIVGNDVFWGV